MLANGVVRRIEAAQRRAWIMSAYFGAITGQAPASSQGQIPARPVQFPGSIPQIKLSPFYVSGGAAGFSSVSWYGADDVVTLGPVSGAGREPGETTFRFPTR